MPRGRARCFVSAALTAGTTVADARNPASPVEIGFYEALEPVHATERSPYRHNGMIYATDVERRLDLVSLDHPAVEDTATLAGDNPKISSGRRGSPAPKQRHAGTDGRRLASSPGSSRGLALTGRG
jgi:hypothetical protein